MTFDFLVTGTEPRRQALGRVLWITGLSGAGKSTLAYEVVARLRATGEAVVLLDGDELRDVFGAVAANAQNYGREGRLALAMQYAHLCRAISAQGLTVVIATISLFREVHIWNRANLPCYFEVYLKVPVDELRRRDPKGIYRRFDAGELANVAGLDLPIDEPEAADWVVEFEPDRSAATIAIELLKTLKLKGAL
jgi:adenylylsulfate kinase-like enzyme